MSGVAATRGSSLAVPYACAYASCPCVTTATVALGTPVLESTAVAIESTRADSASPARCACVEEELRRSASTGRQQRRGYRSVMTLNGKDEVTMILADIRGAERRKVYDLPKTSVPARTSRPTSRRQCATQRSAIRNAKGARIHAHINRSAVRYVVAEIPITRKERRNIWPMLVGLLALVLVLGFLFGRRHVAKPGLASDTTSSTTSATSNGAVADTSRHP